MEGTVAAREQAAYERGLHDGRKSMNDAMLQQRCDLRSLETGVLSSLKDLVPAVKANCESAMVALALELAQKVLGNVPISPEIVEGVVREALRDVEDAPDCHVLLNAEDLALLEKVQSPVFTENAGRVRFQASPEVTRGGCIIKTRFGTVDARRETKLDNLKQALEP